MKRTLRLGAIVAALAATGAIVRAQSQQGKGAIFATSSTAQFTEIAPGASTHTIWGDAARGPFGSFTKFTPGYDAGTHTHTNDVLLVVLRGAYLYRDDAGDKRVGPGDFIRIPGGHKHWSGGDAREGALFYQETFGKFDLVPAK